MKVQCHREALLTACSIASAVVPARSPKPILRNLKLEVGADGVATLTATDLEQGLRYNVSGVTVETPGKALLKASEFIAILREMPDETFRLEATDSGLRIRGASSKFDLPSEDPAEFPDLPAPEAKATFRMQAAKLGTLIKRTIFAAATENARFHLASVLMEFEPDGAVRFVATDSKRLALMPGKSEPAADMTGAALVSALAPPKALKLVERTLQDPEEMIEIVLGANDARFTGKKVTIYTRLIEGRFPPWQTVVPKDSKTKVPLVVEKIHAALRQAKIVASVESKGVKFLFSKGQLTLSAQGADVGESEVVIPIAYDGADLEVRFDPDLFAEALKVLDPTEEAHLHLTDGKKAAVLRTGDQYAYVVMPLTGE